MATLNRRALLMLGGASLLTANGVTAQEVWERWGGAPYAANEREAYSDAKIDFAMEHLGVPTQIRDELRSAIRADRDGTVGYLDPSDRLVGMMSGPDREHRSDHVMRDVQVGRTVIRRGVVAAAEVRTWDAVYEGRIYRLVLPLICWNWSLMIIGVEVQEWCPEVHIPTLPGDRVMFEISGPSALPASLCLAIKHSDQTEWTAIPSECPAQTVAGSRWAGANCDFAAARVNAMRVIPELRLQRQHGGGFNARGGVTILRLPRQVLERDVYMVFVCVLRGGRQSRSVGVEYHNYLGQHPPTAVIFPSPEQIPEDLIRNHRGPRVYDLALEFE